MTRYEVSLYIGPCSQEEAEALMEAITDLPEAHAVGAGAVGLAPFEEPVASSVSAGAVKALIADASEPFLVPDVTPRGASKAAVFHVLRDMVDAGALEHHVDGYRRPNAAASAGAGQVPADIIEKAIRPLLRAWHLCANPAFGVAANELEAALAAVRTPKEQT
jgi:hypothetical protein